MRLPTQKKILREDLKEAPAWIDKLLYPINSFFETVFNGLAKQLTFTENIACQIKEMEFTAGSSWVPLTFQKTIKTKAIGCLILQLSDVTDGMYAPVTDAVSIDWYESKGSIFVAAMAGVTTGRKYRLRVLVI